MSIFTKKQPKENVMNMRSSEDSIIQMQVGGGQDEYDPLVSGSYAEYDPTRIPINLNHQYPPYFNSTGTFNPFKYPVLSDEMGHIEPRLELSDELINKMWEKMYERPVIVRCSHCNSHNVITNPTCIQCGAPMGDYKRMKKYE